MNKLMKVAKDTIQYEFPKPLVKKINKLFFDFCREHDIKHGTPIKRDGEIIGLIFDTMTHDFFFNRLKDACNLEMMFSEDIPEDAKKGIGDVVDSVQERANELLNSEFTLETAKEELEKGLKKGLEVFDYMDLSDEDITNIKNDITYYALARLEENFKS